MLIEAEALPMPKRKRSKSKTRKKKANPFGFFFRRLFVLILIFIVLTGAGLALLLGLGSHFFKLKTNQNFVIASGKIGDEEGKIFFAHLSPVGERAAVVELDSQATVEVIDGYGEYQLSAVFPLLTLEKKDQKFLQAAASFATGRVVDYVVLQSHLPNQLNKKELSRILLKETLDSFPKRKYLGQLLESYFFIQALPIEKISFGEQSLAVSELSDQLLETEISGCSLAVVNTTKTSGLANQVSSLAEESGVEVVRVTDTEESLPVSAINITQEQEACQLLAERLQSIFPTQVQIVEHQAARAEHRADIVILIGEDLAN